MHLIALTLCVFILLVSDFNFLCQTLKLSVSARDSMLIQTHYITWTINTIEYSHWIYVMRREVKEKKNTNKTRFHLNTPAEFMPMNERWINRPYNWKKKRREDSAWSAVDQRVCVHCTAASFNLTTIYQSLNYCLSSTYIDSLLFSICCGDWFQLLVRPLLLRWNVRLLRCSVSVRFYRTF